MLLFWRNVKDILDFEGMTQKELASAINESTIHFNPGLIEIDILMHNKQ